MELICVGVLCENISDWIALCFNNNRSSASLTRDIKDANKLKKEKKYYDHRIVA